MQLIRSPWSETFDEFGQAIRAEAILVAPFIRAEPLEQLKKPLLQLESRPRIDLITNLAADSLFRGMVDTAALTDFARDLSEERVMVRNLPGLHAKTYVADESLAIITSGNLTRASLDTNSEYGVKVTKPELVRQIIADIRAYSSLSTEIPLSHLEQVTARTLLIQKSAEFRTAENQAVQYLQRDLAAILATLKDEADDDRVDHRRELQGELPRQVFGRTILNLLRERGPLSTRELYPLIRERHPELCDDSVPRETSTGVQHKEQLWKFQVRVAQKRHREGGRVVRLADGKWRLVEGTAPLAGR